MYIMSIPDFGDQPHAHNDDEHGQYERQPHFRTPSDQVRQRRGPIASVLRVQLVPAGHRVIYIDVNGICPFERSCDKRRPTVFALRKIAVTRALCPHKRSAGKGYAYRDRVDRVLGRSIAADTLATDSNKRRS